MPTFASAKKNSVLTEHQPLLASCLLLLSRPQNRNSACIDRCEESEMFHQGWLRLALAAGLAVSAFGADVIIRVAPPRPIVERRVVSPGRDYVWVPGYHRWDSRAYVWVPG